MNQNVYRIQLLKGQRMVVISEELDTKQKLVESCAKVFGKNNPVVKIDVVAKACPSSG